MATVRPWISSQHFVYLRRDLYCNAMQWLLFILPGKKNDFYIPVSSLIQWIQKNFAFLISLLTKNLVIWYIHIVSVKAFCHSNKHDFSSELFSNLSICWQPPNNLEFAKFRALRAFAPYVPWFLRALITRLARLTHSRYKWSYERQF